MDADQITIESMAETDWRAVRAIYIEGIESKNATFEKSAPEWPTWNDAHLKTCRIVARSANVILGWAALSSVSTRHVYHGVAEVSIYVSACARGKKIGSRLLATLIERSEQNGIWTLQAGVFPENIPSIKLHKQNGFRVIGFREKVGCMDGNWRDVCLLERRSKVVVNP